MGYEKFCATYNSLREKHRNDPGALEIIERFGREVAWLRVLDILSSCFMADLAIAKAKQAACPGC